MVSIIAAMDSNRGIGKNNSIPWHIPEDFKHFKEVTMGHPIIMGRRTFESLGRVLPGRTHIVITRDLKNKTEVPGVFWANSLEDAVKKSQEILKQVQDDNVKKEIFIIGGGQIYKEAIEKDLVDRLYLTIIEARLDSPPESPARRGDFGADTFFPDYSKFKIVSEEEHQAGKYKFKFVSLVKEA